MAKKGAIEIQFNWLFVLIVGVLILLFFTRVTFKYQEISEGKIAGAVLSNLDTIAVGAASSRDTDQLIDIPAVDMRITSTEDCYRTYKIGRNNRRLEDVFIFSPERIEGNKLIFWTLDWSLPYRITNLVFLTSPLVRYIIVGDTALANEVYDTFRNKLAVPMHVDKLATSSEIPSLRNMNNYNVRFIFFGESPSGIHLGPFTKMPDQDVTALYIEPDPITFEETGRLQFYQKRGDSLAGLPEANSAYIKHEAMWGAIFSGNYHIYDCNMKAAFERLRFVSQLYQNRTRLLHQTYQAEHPGCASYYFAASITDNEPKILEIRDLSKKMSSEFPGDYDTDIRDLYHYAYHRDPVDHLDQGLKYLNDNVLYYSCPEIY